MFEKKISHELSFTKNVILYGTLQITIKSIKLVSNLYQTYI